MFTKIGRMTGRVFTKAIVGIATMAGELMPDRHREMENGMVHSIAITLFDSQQV
jgi:hypothetical protein